MASAALGERNSPDGSDRGPSVGTVPARRLKRTLDSSPRVLDSSGPWSPKPARIYANPRVQPRRGDPRHPHCHAVSGASSRLLRLPENRGVPGSIPGLAISPFCLLIAAFCGCRCGRFPLALGAVFDVWSPIQCPKPSPLLGNRLPAWGQHGDVGSVERPSERSCESEQIRPRFRLLSRAPAAAAAWGSNKPVGGSARTPGVTLR